MRPGRTSARHPPYISFTGLNTGAARREGQGWDRNAYPGRLLSYEGCLGSYLDGGGHLLVSGQDILDQGAGTTDFVRDYLHITWDGTEVQNDKPTHAVHAVAGTLTDGAGAVPIDHSVLQATFEDQITPNGGATSIFTDDAGQSDALAFANSTYKVVFLAFPMEA